MERNNGKIFNNIQNRKTANDKIYTPPVLAKKMIEMCDIKYTDRVLDPCKGGGVFYDNFPECIKSYCEIDEGIDFFNYDQEVDIIIGNPPYSLWSKWIEKTISLNPKKICYVYGAFNMCPNRFDLLEKNGYYVRKIHIMNVSWWLGTSFLVLLTKEKNDFFEIDTSKIYCDRCGLSKCRNLSRKENSNVNICRFEN